MQEDGVSITLLQLTPEYIQGLVVLHIILIF